MAHLLAASICPPLGMVWVEPSFQSVKLSTKLHWMPKCSTKDSIFEECCPSCYQFCKFQPKERNFLFCLLTISEAWPSRSGGSISTIYDMILTRACTIVHKEHFTRSRALFKKDWFLNVSLEIQRWFDKFPMVTGIYIIFGNILNLNNSTLR